MNAFKFLGFSLAIITAVSFQKTSPVDDKITLENFHYTDSNGWQQGLYISSDWNFGNCTNVLSMSYYWYKNDTIQFFVDEFNDQNYCYEVLHSHDLMFNRKLNDTLILQLHLITDESLRSFLAGISDSSFVQANNSVELNHTINQNSLNYFTGKPDSIIFSFMKENVEFGNSLSPFYNNGKIISGEYVILDKKNWKIIDSLKF